MTLEEHVSQLRTWLALAESGEWDTLTGLLEEGSGISVEAVHQAVTDSRDASLLEEAASLTAALQALCARNRDELAHELQNLSRQRRLQHAYRG
ncbi:Flagellar protein FliT [Gulbenkiania indica]|uniref:Flagellar protein FliT n=1 Tax=Gulbenkiania indica TaxID=375574 RepID=A0A0K6H370_9NEIS|nr:flagellar protein FliT [Gulbenkiania indica]CUA85271.1 Flagellar protein FliT [Gulbenkiania indica]